MNRTGDGFKSHWLVAAIVLGFASHGAAQKDPSYDQLWGHVQQFVPSTLSFSCGQTTESCDACLASDTPAAACATCAAHACSCQDQSCAVGTSRASVPNETPRPNPADDSCGTCSVVTVQPSCADCYYSRESGELYVNLGESTAELDRAAVLVSDGSSTAVYPLGSGEADLINTAYWVDVSQVTSPDASASLLYRTYVGGRAVWLSETVPTF